MSKSPKKRSRAWLAVVPLYLWTVVLVLAPLLYVLVLSLSTKKEPFGVEYLLNFENYRRIFSPMYLEIILLSLRVALMTTLVTLLVAYPFAYIMARQPARRKTLLMLLVVVPFWTNALMRTYGWITLMRTKGMINALLLNWGLIDSPLKMLYNDGAVLFGMIYSLLPFMILPLYSSLEKMDWTVVEASRDLGAGAAKAFLTVTLPLTLPGMLSGCVLVFVPSVGLYFISDLLGGGKSILLGNLINNQLTVARDWPFGAALSMMMIVMTFLILAVYRRFSGGGDLEVF